MSNRFTDIDIAKGLCIILVVIGHYKPDNSPDWYHTLIDVIYCFHMPLFMYASGFIYHATKKPVTYQKFVWKKFKRLVIPYIFVSWLIICIKLLMESNMYVENPVSLTSFYEILYIPAAGYFLWFVYVLFLIFLIIPFFGTPQKVNFLLLISLIWLIIPVETTTLFCIAPLKKHLFYFVFGCFISQYQNLIHQKIERINILILVVCFIILYLLTQIFSNSLIIFVLQCIHLCLALVGIWITLKISHYLAVNTQNLKYIFVQLAIYSYTIYLFHTSFEGFAKSLFIKFPITAYFPNNISFCIMVLIAVCAGIAGPIFLHLTFERVKKCIKSFC